MRKPGQLAVVGVTGYTGFELARILVRHALAAAEQLVDEFFHCSLVVAKRRQSVRKEIIAKRRQSIRRLITGQPRSVACALKVASGSTATGSAVSCLMPTVK